MRTRFALPVWILIGFMLASHLPAMAQEQQPSRRDSTRIKERVGSLVDAVEGEEDTAPEVDPESFEFEPLVGGLRSGASVTAGVRFTPLQTRNFMSAVEARASIRKYWSVGGLLGYQFGNNVVHGFGRYRHMPEEDFYGIGPDVTEDGRSNYRLNDIQAGALIGRIPFDRVLVGLHASYLENDLGLGLDDDTPTIPEEYPSLDIPGFPVDTRYAVVGLLLEYDGRDVPYRLRFGSRFAPTRHRIRNMAMTASRGLYASADVRYYAQLNGETLNFAEAELESQQFVPHGSEGTGLALREYLLATFTGADNDIPFYLMPTLGGTRTLRGYRSYVFRDRNALMGSVEYRWRFWEYIQPALFVDAGYVFPALDELDVADPTLDVGAAIRLVYREKVRVRVVAAYGEEGLRTFVRIGSYY